MLGIIKNPPGVSSAQVSPEKAEDHVVNSRHKWTMYDYPWRPSVRKQKMKKYEEKKHEEIWKMYKKKRKYEENVQEEIQDEEMVDAILSR